MPSFLLADLRLEASAAQMAGGDLTWDKDTEKLKIQDTLLNLICIVNISPITS